MPLKGGNKKQWQTTAGAAKAAAAVRGGSILPGDSGIWVTCVRSKEGKATIEIKDLFAQHAASIYEKLSDEKVSRDAAKDKKQVDEDIEASIAAELASLTSTRKDENGSIVAQQFQPVFLDVPCVLFFKTHTPVNPAEFVERMCLEIAENAKAGVPSKTRFANRLTPMSLMGKASYNGLKDVARKVLFEHFKLADDKAKEEAQEETEGKLDQDDVDLRSNHTYAIRPTIRNHNTLQRGAVIQMIAELINQKHAVNLSKPDKVILVEIYQVCSIL